MWKMFSVQHKRLMPDGRIARFVGEPIQAKTWDAAQVIADRRGLGETVTGMCG